MTTLTIKEIPPYHYWGIKLEGVQGWYDTGSSAGRPMMTVLKIPAGQHLLVLCPGSERWKGKKYDGRLWLAGLSIEEKLDAALEHSGSSLVMERYFFILSDDDMEKYVIRICQSDFQVIADKGRMDQTVAMTDAILEARGNNGAL